jgi:hypothetical protein
VIVGIMLVTLALGAYYYSSKNPKTTTPAEVSVTTPTLIPSPTPESPTADWNIYANAMYGYSIKYPKDWFDRGDGRSGSVYQHAHNFSYNQFLPYDDAFVITDSVSVYVINTIKNNSIALDSWDDLSGFIADIDRLEPNQPTNFEGELFTRDVVFTKKATFKRDGRDVYKLRIATQPNAYTIPFDHITYYAWDGEQIINVSTGIPFESPYTATIEQMVEDTLSFTD